MSSRVRSRLFTLTIGGRVRTYTVRRSRKARHVLLHVSADSRIEVVVPRGRTLADAHAFVKTRRQWIAQTLRRYRASGGRVRLVHGSRVPVLGKQYVVRVTCQVGRSRSFVRCGQEHIEVRVGNRRQVRAAFALWCRRRAWIRFSRWAHQYADVLGVGVRRVVVSDFTTQWGSCVQESGRLAFNWRLLLAPPHVARYVVAHEVAHLVQGDHSSRFWAVVARLDSSYEQHRLWLRERGHTLTV